MIADKSVVIDMIVTFRSDPYLFVLVSMLGLVDYSTKSTKKQRSTLPRCMFI